MSNHDFSVQDLEDSRLYCPEVARAFTAKQKGTPIIGDVNTLNATQIKWLTSGYAYEKWPKLFNGNVAKYIKDVIYTYKDVLLLLQIIQGVKAGICTLDDFNKDTKPAFGGQPTIEIEENLMLAEYIKGQSSPGQNRTYSEFLRLKKQSR